MHKFSGCAGDGKLTVSTREPHRGSLSMEGMYMVILLRCSLDHKSIPVEFVRRWPKANIDFAGRISHETGPEGPELGG